MMLKKTLAVAAVVALICSVVPVALLSVTALSSTADADGFYTPVFSQDVAASTSINTWDPSKMVVSQSPAQGVRAVWTNGAAGNRVPSEKQYPLDGLTLRFGGMTKADGYSGAADLRITYGIAYAQWSGTFRIVLDTTNGRVFYGTDAANTVISDSSLLYNNLSQKSFAVSFSVGTGGDYTVSVKVGTANALSGTIPAAFITSTGINVSGGYFCYAPNSAASFTMDWTGFKSVPTDNRLVADIDSIGSPVSLADEKMINLCDARYRSLSEEAQAKITNSGKLLQAVDSYQNLFKDSNSAYTILKDAEGSVSSISSNVNTFWKDIFYFSQVPNDGGVRLSWVNGAKNCRQGLAGKLNLDGFNIKFNRFVKTSGDVCEFAIFFANTPMYQYTTSKGGLTIALNAVSGTVTAYTNNTTYTTVITDDLLKYSSIAGSSFVMSFDKEDNGDYTVGISVGGQSVTGTIPASCITAAAQTLTDPGACYATVSAWSSATCQTLDVVGTYSVIKTNRELQALLETLRSVTVDSADTLLKAQGLYAEMDDATRAKVTNLEILNTALESYIRLRLETLHNPISCDDAKTINELNILYSRFTDDQKSQLQASRELQEANDAYRAFIKKGLTSPTEKHVWSKSTNEWWNTFHYEEVENGNGIRMTWTGAGRDIRQGINQPVNLNGMKIQFNALHKLKSDSNSDFAIYLSDEMGASWNSPGGSTARPFVLLVDPDAGTITAQPAGIVIIQSDIINYDNIENSTWTLEFNLLSGGLYELKVAINEDEVCGTISADALQAGEKFTKPEACYITISEWTAGYLSLEITGIGPSILHSRVITMIDAIGVVTKSSEAAIMSAEQAYAALPDYAKARVINYSKLTEARSTFDSLQPDDPTEYIADLIDNLGIIDAFSGKKLKEVEGMYDLLSGEQKSYVRNAGALEKAVIDYYGIMAPKMYLDSYIYGVSDSNLYWGNAKTGTMWPERFTDMDIGTGGVTLEWKDGNRNLRDCLGTYNLDGLSLMMGNFKQIENSNANESNSKKLAVLIAPKVPHEFNAGAFGLSANKAMALLLDTQDGTLTACPAGSFYIPPVVVLQDDALKYENLTNKTWEIIFSENINESYKLRMVIDDGTVLTGTIPFSVMASLQETGSLSEVFLEFSAWGPASYMSVDCYSVKTADDPSAYEMILPVMNAIDKLPSADRIVLEDEPNVLKVADMYQALGKRGLKMNVTNYEKLSKIMWKLDDLKTAAGINPYTNEKIENDHNGEGADTGETENGLPVVFTLLSGYILVFFRRRQKRFRPV